MTQNLTDMSALLGSRICHDLISPIGAIGNGIELLEMSAGAGADEIGLVADSVISANIRIRFFRIAYGIASVNQLVSEAEVSEILDGMSSAGRIRYRWTPIAGLNRRHGKMIFLLVQCLETTLPYGGEIAIRGEGGNFTLTATGREIRLQDALWAQAKGLESDADIEPATVQFGLVPREIARERRHLLVESDGARITLTV